MDVGATDYGDTGLLTWSFDPVAASLTSAPTAGTQYLVRLPVRKTIEPTRAVQHCITPGSGAVALANVYLGLYDKLGVLRGKSADLATNFSTAGNAVGASAQVLVAEAGQSMIIDVADGWCFWSLIVGTQSSTPMALRAGAGNSGVANVVQDQNSTPPARIISKAAVGSALPATVTFSTFVNANVLYFTGLAA